MIWLYILIGYLIIGVCVMAQRIRTWWVAFVRYYPWRTLGDAALDGLIWPWFAVLWIVRRR